MFEIIFFIILFIFFGIFILWLFSDEHLDKEETKMIKKIVEERDDKKCLK